MSHDCSSFRKLQQSRQSALSMKACEPLFGAQGRILSWVECFDALELALGWLESIGRRYRRYLRLRRERSCPKNKAWVPARTVGARTEM